MYTPTKLDRYTTDSWSARSFTRSLCNRYPTANATRSLHDFFSNAILLIQWTMDYSNIQNWASPFFRLKDQLAVKCINSSLGCAYVFWKLCPPKSLEKSVLYQFRHQLIIMGRWWVNNYLYLIMSNKDFYRHFPRKL